AAGRRDSHRHPGRRGPAASRRRAGAGIAGPVALREPGALSPMCQTQSRAAFHQARQADAERDARPLLAQRDALVVRWLTWVAGELYRLTQPPYEIGRASCRGGE